MALVSVPYVGFIMDKEAKIKISLFQEDGKLDNRAICAGVYIVELLRDDEPLNPLKLYIGQSFYMIKRCGEHLRKFLKEPDYFGLEGKHLMDERLELRFRVLDSLTDDSWLGRIEKEKLRIKEHNPITQFPYSDRQRRDKGDIVKREMAKCWKNNG